MPYGKKKAKSYRKTKLRKIKRRKRR